MKKKRWQSMLLAAAMVAMTAAQAATAWAAGTTGGKFTLEITTKEKGHQYEAYQVFGGDYAEMDEKGVLSNIRWGTAVDGKSADLLAGLKADSTIGQYFTDAATAADVAKALQDTEHFANDSSNLDQFAEVVEKNLGDTKVTLTEPTSAVEGVYIYYAELDPGYYLVKDKNGSMDGTQGSYTKFMLQMIQDAKVSPKADTPKIDKNILADGAETKWGSSNIGDTVTFRLTSAVPQMDGYNKFYFVIKDTLPKGFEYLGNVVAKVGDTTLASGDYEASTTAAGDNVELEIVLKNFIQYRTDAYIGKAITVDYDVRLTKDAVVGVEGNKNLAKLIYSNNPAYDYAGEGAGDKPGSNTPVGETTEVNTYTYTTKLQVMKVGEDGKPLPGAAFKLEGNGLKTIIKSHSRKTKTYVLDDNGYYVKDDDGTMRPSTAEDAGKPHYTENQINDTVVTSYDETGAASDIQVSVDPYGGLVFTGLGAGTYTLTETQAPQGYNKLETPITLTVKCKFPQEGSVGANASNCTWSYSAAGGMNVQEQDAEDGIIKLEVINKKGSMLPSTGGIGTTVFTVAGLILMVGAVLFLAIKGKREKVE